MKSKPKSSGRFPDEVTLKRVRDKLSQIDYEGGNLALPSHASQVDRAKYEICQLIAKHQKESGLLQRDIASQIGVDESRISDILRGRIDGFTLDRLISYAEKLRPGLKVKIVA